MFFFCYFKINPPLKPKILDKFSVDNFDDEFTKENPINSFITTTKTSLLHEYEKDFVDFSYSPDKKLDKNVEFSDN